MTLKSDHNTPNEKPGSSENEITQWVNQALDQSVAAMPNKVQSDIAKARREAISQSQKPNTLVQYLLPLPKVAIPVAAAALIVVMMPQINQEPVPALPVAMVTSQIPTEDLSLLESLEFVTWLAENEQETLL